MASKKRGCEQQQGEQQPNSFHQGLSNCFLAGKKRIFNRRVRNETASASSQALELITHCASSSNSNNNNSNNNKNNDNNNNNTNSNNNTTIHET
jgi:hypothetical protein